MVNQPKSPDINNRPVCPAEPVADKLSFSYEEIEPLLAFLKQNEAVVESQSFQRGTVTKQQTLDCCKQDLGPVGAHLLTEALKENSKVEAILFGTGSIGNEGAKSVAGLLEKNQTIKTVYLGCNHIDAEGIEHLAASLRMNKSVRALWLKRNPIGTEGVKALASLLSYNRNIRTLDLVNTLIGEKGLELLIQALLETAYPLERLYLSGNYLTESCAPHLNKLLANCPSLKQLFISVNRLGDKGVIKLSEGLALNKTLEDLSLASNGITATGIVPLLSTLESHPSLYSFDLGYSPSTKALGASGNNIGDQGAASIGHFLSTNKTLMHLDVRKNNIGLYGLKQINNGLQKNSRLLNLLYSSIKSPGLKEEINNKLAANRQHTSFPDKHEDIKAVKSIYR